MLHGRGFLYGIVAAMMIGEYQAFVGNNRGGAAAAKNHNGIFERAFIDASTGDARSEKRKIHKKVRASQSIYGKQIAASARPKYPNFRHNLPDCRIHSGHKNVQNLSNGQIYQTPLTQGSTRGKRQFDSLCCVNVPPIHQDDWTDMVKKQTVRPLK